MKQIRLISKLIALSSLIVPTTSESMANKALLIDTSGSDEHAFFHLQEHAKNAGFLISFYSLFEQINPDLASYDAIFIALDGRLLQALVQSLGQRSSINPLVAKFTTLLGQISSFPDKLICLMMPGINQVSQPWIQLCSSLAQGIVKGKSDGLSKSQIASLNKFLSTLMLPDHALRRGQETSLLNAAREKIVTWPLITDEKESIYILPHSIHEKSGIFASMPLALYLKNQQTGAQLVITKSSLISSNDLNENFMFASFDMQERDAFRWRLQELLHDIYAACQKRPFSLHKTDLSLPESLQKLSALDALPESWRQLVQESSIWCGWADPDSYKACEERAGDNLAAMNLNVLWMEWNPEWYLANRARRSEQREQFLKNVESFTHGLTKAAEVRGKVPAVFLGTDLTSNFATTVPTQAVRDIFGATYANIPTPLDFDNFWKPELLDVFDRFLKEWPKISNGVPLAGIFLDFEMYHAQQQTGQYTSLMDFSDHAWSMYAKARPEAKSFMGKTIEEKVEYLFKHKGLKDYFFVLQEAACDLGRTIKKHLQTKVPNLRIGAYNMTLPHSWFYKGLLAGLSSKEEPVLMATFNNDFSLHQEWFKKQGIYLVHVPAVMLAKLEKKNDFKRVLEQVKYHHGVWFNRISRLEESRDRTQWRWDYGIEVTPMETPVFVAALAAYIRTMQTDQQEKKH